MSGAEDLARTLCLRQPGSVYRFSLRNGPERELRLAATRNGAAGANLAEGGASHAGLAVVDEDGMLVFCAPSEPDRLLRDLSEWARSVSDRLPAAAALIGAGAVRHAGGTAPDLAGAAIRRDRTLWSGVANPGPGQLAAVLRAAAPGVRLWYWLTDAPGRFGMPLLLQPVGTDPNRDFLNAEVDVVSPGGPGPAVTGIGYLAEDGVLQLLGPGLQPGHLTALAAWVRVAAEDQPGVLRLAHARLLRTVNGRIDTVIEDASLWDGLPPTDSGA